MVGEVHLEVGFEGTIVDETSVRETGRQGVHGVQDITFSVGMSTRLIVSLRNLIPQFSHGLVEDLLVSFVAQVGYEATLLGAQQIASATDVEILHGDVDT